MMGYTYWLASEGIRSSPLRRMATQQEHAAMTVCTLSSFFPKPWAALNTREMAAGARPTIYQGLPISNVPMRTPHVVRTTSPGRFHRKNARSPPGMPACEVAVEITSCVDVGPGSPCPIANSSVKASSPIQFRWTTRWSRKIATWACGPPKATRPSIQKTRNTSPTREAREPISTEPISAASTSAEAVGGDSASVSAACGSSGEGAMVRRAFEIIIDCAIKSRCRRGSGKTALASTECIWMPLRLF
mmetsp:Transcript_24423/g.55733  ORF Transcript_24423/g.55733 Transcript_24423/m.55733 type:complete len:246 (+) Transcript_24423:1205-1942(+)